MPLASPLRSRPLRRLAAACASAALLGAAVVVTPAPDGQALLVPQAAAACQVSGEQVSSGHFDVGPSLDGGTLAPRVKDDRTSPPRWRSPGEVVFTLGDAAAVRLPSGLGFIGAAGTPVHMIGGVQQSGVPWLGWNTQNPALLAAATGPVTMTLQSVSGPGDLAVFTSGTFGTAVGQRVMDTVGGPRSTTVPLNTHAHGNWVFTKPGVYRVGLSFSVPTDAGTRSGSTTLTFAVGGCTAAAPAAAQRPASAPQQASSRQQAPAQRQAPAQQQAPAQRQASPAAEAAAPAAEAAAQPRPQAAASAQTAPAAAAQRTQAGAGAAASPTARPGAWPGTVAAGTAATADGSAGADTAARTADAGGEAPAEGAGPAPAEGAPGAPADPATGGTGGLRALGPTDDPAALASATAATGPHWPSLAIGAGAILVLIGFGAGVYRLARAR